ncbi:asparagine synthase B, partial [Vibrio cholerae]
MCSIFGILDIKSDAATLRPVALEMSKKLRHRGPDWSGIYASDSAISAHERLAIVCLNSVAQPLYSPARKLILAVTGDMYNQKESREGYDGT